MIRLLRGDCRKTLKTLVAGSVQCCVTSPPYFGLRDYGTPPLVWGGIEHEHEWGDEARSNPGTGRFCLCGAWLGSLGLEPDTGLYIEHLVDVFREVKRVLRDDGTCWINLGDSYAGSGKGPSSSLSSLAGSQNPHSMGLNSGVVPIGYKPKDLMMMPFRVAMALQADGWYLRSVIPWLKRTTMPESVGDRPSTAVEYVFLLAKSNKYFWDADAVRQTAIYGGEQLGIVRGQKRRATAMGVPPSGNEKPGADANIPTNRNRRNSDWFMESWKGLMLDEHDEPLSLVVNPMPFSGAHFATFPPKLVEPMVKASTSEKGQCPECRAPWVRVTEKGERVRQTNGTTGAQASIAPRGAVGSTSMLRDGKIRTRNATGWRSSCAHTDAAPVPQVVCDPFGGSGTVGLVADRLGRDAILCELKSDYADMGADRIIGDNPMFTELDAS